MPRPLHNDSMYCAGLEDEDEGDVAFNVETEQEETLDLSQVRVNCYTSVVWPKEKPMMMQQADYLPCDNGIEYFV